MDTPPPPPPPPPTSPGQPNQPFGATMSLECPSCRGPVTVPASNAGNTYSCPHCGAQFNVPYPTAGVTNRYDVASPEAARFASEKKILAGVLAIVLGGFGVHKFILGFSGTGAIMLAVTLVCSVLTPCLVIPVFGVMAMSIIGLIEGIMYLTKSDEEFYQLYSVQRKEWF